MILLLSTVLFANWKVFIFTEHQQSLKTILPIQFKQDNLRLLYTLTLTLYFLLLVGDREKTSKFVCKLYTKEKSSV